MCVCVYYFLSGHVERVNKFTPRLGCILHQKFPSISELVQKRHLSIFPDVQDHMHSQAFFSLLNTVGDLKGPSDAPFEKGKKKMDFHKKGQHCG